MKKTLLLLGIGFLIAGNLFANAEFAEMVAYEEEMKVEYAKKAAIEKNINLKISTSEFYSGKIDGKSVSYPGTNLYEADGNP